MTLELFIYLGQGKEGIYQHLMIVAFGFSGTGLGVQGWPSPLNGFWVFMFLYTTFQAFRNWKGVLANLDVKLRKI